MHHVKLSQRPHGNEQIDTCTTWPHNMCIYGNMVDDTISEIAVT